MAIENYVDYSRIKRTAEFGTLPERAAAAAEIEEFKSKDPKHYRWYSNQYDTGSVADPAPAPASVSKPKSKSKAKVKGKVLSYQEFCSLFEAVDSKDLTTMKESPLRQLTKFRQDYPKEYESYRKKRLNLPDRPKTDAEVWHNSFVHCDDL